MAKNMAFIENGHVSRIEWRSDRQLETDELKDCHDKPVHTGDSFSGGTFFRDGEEILSPMEELRKENEALVPQAQKFEAVLSASSETYPIPYAVGDEVVKDYWYACQRIKALAIDSGVPTGMTDDRFFTDWQTF